MALATPNEIVAALKDYRCNVHEMSGWRTRGRSYSFSPYGQAVHHDAFGESYADLAAAEYMTFKGRPDLPPPLCNGAIGNYGTVFLCAYGNANHAGYNRASVHRRLSNGQAPLGWARDQAAESDTLVGNSRLWGWECRNAGTGRDPWDQLDVMVRAMAAMADCCGWSANAIAGHGELTTRKIDPVGFSMPNYRLSVAKAQTDHNAVTPKEGEEMTAKMYWFRGRKATTAEPNPPAHCYTVIGNVATWHPTHESIHLASYLGTPLHPDPLDPVWWQAMAMMNGPLKNT